MESRARRQMSDTLCTWLLLALSGGCLDAYTYLTRGRVFANSITGNVVMMALGLAQGDFVQALRNAAPVAAYIAGVCTAEQVRRRLTGARFHWRQYILLAEMAIAAAAAFVPAGSLDLLVNTSIAFTCAMQVESFRKLEGYLPVATTMCTGNMRSASELLYHAVADHDRKALSGTLRYFAVTAAFITGAVVCVPLVNRFGTRAVLAAELPWLLVIIRLSYQPE